MVPFFDAHFDTAALVDDTRAYAYEQLAQKEGKSQEFDAFWEKELKGVKEDFQKQAYGRRLAKNYQDTEAVLTFLRMTTKNGQHRAIFRLSAEDTFNYTEMEIKTMPDGSFAVGELLFYNVGVPLSHLIGNVLLNLFHAQSGLVNKIMKKGEAHQAGMKQLIAAQNAHKSGDIETASELLNSVRSPVKRYPFCHDGQSGALQPNRHG